ncbi:nucleoside transporter [Hafnia paralvei]|nr:nucleoside transporter [Hafnia paralvei]RDA63058.1 nucleoside transporter [Hafnia paralvei]RDA63898.1 nucleoside transporter [Hafnia paralvei]RDA75184.1 nucleoside transporter [Hafnia paralvei]RDA75508.1 nucleoside transporter [Hafnia paralvei]
MKEGVYNVVFESHDESFGEGILVVSHGTVNGGDIGFIYQGKLQRPVMTLKVRQYQPDILSVVGIEGEYTLEMRYEEEQEHKGHYCLSGTVIGMPEKKITAYAFFLADVVR